MILKGFMALCYQIMLLPAVKKKNKNTKYFLCDLSQPLTSQNYIVIVSVKFFILLLKNQIMNTDS